MGYTALADLLAEYGIDQTTVFKEECCGVERRFGDFSHLTARPCKYGRCTEEYCDCGALWISYGPVDCPCDGLPGWVWPLQINGNELNRRRKARARKR